MFVNLKILTGTGWQARNQLRLVKSKGDEQSELHQVAPDRPLSSSSIIIIIRVMIIHKHDDDDDESKNADSCDDDLIRILLNRKYSYQLNKFRSKKCL